VTVLVTPELTVDGVCVVVCDRFELWLPDWVCEVTGDKGLSFVFFFFRSEPKLGMAAVCRTMCDQAARIGTGRSSFPGGRQSQDSSSGEQRGLGWTGTGSSCS